ncbi:uncharacterized protein G2W53_038817 [Senna tora]|uniref:Uncharacterized protein n=1 Tax=Senna tora TaxID=362788 RepID=A0A834SN35_9FABA|nr:uncharacterized protein G2W53_038817 [Senna tora]
MARFVLRSLHRHAQFTASSTSSFRRPEVALSPCSLLHHRRHRSSKASKPQLIQIDLGSSSSSSMNEGEYEMALKRFDELIRRILVKKATPDWLPLRPGSSFWVPPRPSSPGSVVDLVEKLTSDLSDEQCLSIASLRGWPSSNFFIQEIESAHHGDADLEVHGPEETGLRIQIQVLTGPENVAQSEDEE